MDMNPRSLSRSHSRSTLHNDTLYSTASRNDVPYHSPIHRPRSHNMSHQQAPQPRQQTPPHQQHSNFSQNAPWSMVPPPILQKVYILDCKSCDTFLTNRGMRAVLLLQPEVPLYSSDALPINCSASPGPLEYAPSNESITASSFTSVCPSGLPAPLPRTCECLTQTLCCHGCGTTVGYMVVIPCDRCTSTVSATNRHTNRHRFVFFNKEITASDRHYIPHEPGIVTTSPVLVSAITPSSSTSSSSSFNAFDSNSPPSASHYNQSYPQYPNYAGVSVPPLPTPPPESPMSVDYPSQASHTFSPLHNRHENPGFPSFQFVTLKPERGRLLAGDVVYWHNLARGGEIPAVVEDERARRICAQSLSSEWAGR